jgi:hypothetical protein
MMRDLNVPGAAVTICQKPLLGGIHQATRWERIAEIIDLYPMADLFLLCVDRDGIAARRGKLDDIEEEARRLLPENRALFAVDAWQEIEVWALAGHTMPRGWAWKSIRAEVHPKEWYFVPFVEGRGVHLLPDQGRRQLAEESARRYRRIKQLCQEDVAALHAKVEAWLNQVSGG